MDHLKILKLMRALIRAFFSGFGSLVDFFEVIVYDRNAPLKGV